MCGGRHRVLKYEANLKFPVRWGGGGGGWWESVDIKTIERHTQVGNHHNLLPVLY